MNLLLVMLLPFLQNPPVEKPQDPGPEKPQDPVPEKVEGLDLLDKGVKTFSLPPVTPVTFEGEKVPTGDVLRKLGEITGFNLSWKYVRETVPVTVSWKKITPLEAFDDLCRQHGNMNYRISMAYSYNNKTGKRTAEGITITFMSGKFPDAPVAYLRHYRVSLPRLTLTRETDFVRRTNEGRFQVMLLWTPDVKPRVLQFFRVEAIEDEQGNSLIKPSKYTSDFHRKIQSGSPYQEQNLHTSATFIYPKVGVSKLARVKGRFLLRYPQEVKEVSFENLEGDVAPLEYRGVTIRLKSCRASLTSVNVAIQVEGKWKAPDDPHLDTKNSWKDPFPFGTADIVLIAEDDSELPMERSSYQPQGKKMTFSLQFKNPAKKKVKMIRIRCAEKFLYDEIPFEWKNVVLPGAD